MGLRSDSTFNFSQCGSDQIGPDTTFHITQCHLLYPYRKGSHLLNWLDHILQLILVNVAKIRYYI